MFNWFRRQFGNAPSHDTAPLPPPEAAPTPAVEEASSPAAEEPEAYLTWAKEAYKNIQERKAQEEVPTEAENPTAATPPEATLPSLDFLSASGPAWRISKRVPATGAGPDTGIRSSSTGT